MANTVFPDTFEAGVKASINHLRGTAEDFEEMANRLAAINHRSAIEQREMKILREKAQLLRGQMLALGHMER